MDKTEVSQWCRSWWTCRSWFALFNLVNFLLVVNIRHLYWTNCQSTCWIRESPPISDGIINGKSFDGRWIPHHYSYERYNKHRHILSLLLLSGKKRDEHLWESKKKLLYFSLDSSPLKSVDELHATASLFNWMKLAIALFVAQAVIIRVIIATMMIIIIMITTMTIAITRAVVIVITSSL